MWGRRRPVKLRGKNLTAEQAYRVRRMIEDFLADNKGLDMHQPIGKIKKFKEGPRGLEVDVQFYDPKTQALFEKHLNSD